RGKHALIRQVMNGKHRCDAGEPSVKPRQHSQIRRDQASLPVVTVHNMGESAEASSQRQRRATEEGKADRVVWIIAVLRAVEPGTGKELILLEKIHGHRVGVR